MEAVGVGYVFNLFDEGDLPGVDLRETGEYVRVDGSLYPLMKAATYEQSRMVDAALDIRGERRVDDFRFTSVEGRFQIYTYDCADLAPAGPDAKIIEGRYGVYAQDGTVFFEKWS